MKTKHKANRVQGMVRSIDQWRNMAPAAVSVGSQAQVEYALHDAKTDIEALWSKLEKLNEALQNALAAGLPTPVADAARAAIAQATGEPQ